MKDHRIVVHTGNEINETGSGEDQSSSVRGQHSGVIEPEIAPSGKWFVQPLLQPFFLGKFMNLNFSLLSDQNRMARNIRKVLFFSKIETLVH
jgi:hypothetical protein